MQDNIDKILHKINELETELLGEIHTLEKEFSYSVLEKKVQFAADALKEHKKQVLNLRQYFAEASFRNIATAPIIWLCIIPALLMDVFITFYQFTCFPVYRIPKVKRSDHIAFDRIYLRYLNIIEKLNCIFCAYFNGLNSYVGEIAARTEQYWCPIKHARRMRDIHSRYKYFINYGDAKGYRSNFHDIRASFDDLQ